MTKEEFRVQANQAIDEVFAKIEELKTKSADVETEAKATYEKSIADLEAKSTEMKNQYEALRDSADEKWEEVKAAFSDASASFEEGFSKIAALF
ncbi:MAG: hypothetical protein AAF806_20925 [Bacteroidota bacterium]